MGYREGHLYAVSTRPERNTLRKKWVRSDEAIKSKLISLRCDCKYESQRKLTSY